MSEYFAAPETLSGRKCQYQFLCIKAKRIRNATPFRFHKFGIVAFECNWRDSKGLPRPMLVTFSKYICITNHPSFVDSALLKNAA